jgi:hypothetical protein
MTTLFGQYQELDGKIKELQRQVEEHDRQREALQDQVRELHRQRSLMAQDIVGWHEGDVFVCGGARYQIKHISWRGSDYWSPPKENHPARRRLHS